MFISAAGCRAAVALGEMGVCVCMDRLARGALARDVGPLAGVHCTDLGHWLTPTFSGWFRPGGACLTSNWPYQGHQVPYLVLRTADCLQPLWSSTEHWPCTLGVCGVAGMSWRMLYGWLIGCTLGGSSRCLHGGDHAGGDFSDFSLWCGWSVILCNWSLGSPPIWWKLLTSAGPQT